MITLLCIDAGNTRVKWQVRCEGRVCAEGVAPTAAPNLELPRSILGLVDACALSAVGSEAAVKRIGDTLASLGLPAPLALSSEAVRGMLRNGYEVPDRMGVDRWLAMVAACASCSLPLVVVDAGTATTVDPIDASGTHLGGFIVIGLRSMLAALGTATAAVGDHGLDAAHNSLVTRNTRQAVLAGALEATRGLVVRAERLLEERTGTLPKVLVTGGDGLALCAGSSNYIWRRDLVLEGIEIVAQGTLMRASAENNASRRSQADA